MRVTVVLKIGSLLCYIVRYFVSLLLYYFAIFAFLLFCRYFVLFLLMLINFKHYTILPNIG